MRPAHIASQTRSSRLARRPSGWRPQADVFSPTMERQYWTRAGAARARTSLRLGILEGDRFMLPDPSTRSLRHAFSRLCAPGCWSPSLTRTTQNSSRTATRPGCSRTHGTGITWRRSGPRLWPGNSGSPRLLEEPARRDPWLLVVGSARRAGRGCPGQGRRPRHRRPQARDRNVALRSARRFSHCWRRKPGSRIRRYATCTSSQIRAMSRCSTPTATQGVDWPPGSVTAGGPANEPA